MRPSKRETNQLRPIEFTTNFTQHAEGSVLVSFGQTKLICTASIVEGVPRFLANKNQGWLTAEYGMLPRSTNERMSREAARGKQSGRTVEIQRLIGRSLRAAVDLNQLNNYTITIDCDVIQADGGTRTAAISGGFVALSLALKQMQQCNILSSNPIKQHIAAISVGIYQGTPVLDLDYIEDSQCDTDMNVIMNHQGEFVEIQGTAEGATFGQDELNAMLDLAKQGIASIIEKQKEAILA